MSQVDTEESRLVGTLSEDNANQSDVTGDGSRLVPVTESIRYRKRAQSAEKKAEQLIEQLNQTKEQLGELTEQLNDMKSEQHLTKKLTAAGAVDLEAAVLLVKSKMTDNQDTEVDTLIEDLKNQKQYLFAGKEKVAAAKGTAAAKDRITNNQSVLQRAAKRAATTGNRTDLQEYLKLRRNHL